MSFEYEHTGYGVPAKPSPLQQGGKGESRSMIKSNTFRHSQENAYTTYYFIVT